MEGEGAPQAQNSSSKARASAWPPTDTLSVPALLMSPSLLCRLMLTSEALAEGG